MAFPSAVALSNRPEVLLGCFEGTCIDVTPGIHQINGTNDFLMGNWPMSSTLKNLI